MAERTHCNGCGDDRLSMFLDMGSSPLADRFPSSMDEELPTYPLRLLLCKSCWLVQLSEVVPDDELWSDYGFYSSTSPALAKYHQEFSDMLYKRNGGYYTNPVVEIACNDGSLLNRLPATRAIGIDPAEGPVKAAQQRGLDVRLGLFGLKAAEELRDEVGPVELVIAQNVAAHVADLQDFLTGIRHLIEGGGTAIIEVQSLADLVLGNQFDHVYHEHRSFFSLLSLSSALQQADMDVVLSERVPMQGGSLRVYCKAGAHTGKIFTSDAAYMGSIFTYGSLQQRADYLRETLLYLLHKELEAGNLVAGYAASAKSTTLLNWLGLSPIEIPYIVDTTPHKIGKFSPGTYIPIVGPGDRPDPDMYILLAFNYAAHFMRNERSFLSSGGKVLIPIPTPQVW